MVSSQILKENLWLIWFSLGIILCVAEIFIPGTVIIWWGLSSLVVSAITYIFDLNFLNGTILCVIMSIICLMAWFRWFRNKFVTFTGQAEEYKQITGQIVNRLTNNRYNAVFDLPVLGDREWIVESTEELSPGDKIQIEKVYGQILKVKKEDI